MFLRRSAKAKAAPAAAEAVPAFRQCPTCSYDFATGEGQRACHYYTCPVVPDELDVFCPVCRYDFLTGEGTPGCSDPPECAFAQTEAPARVATLRAWLAAKASN